MNGIMNSRRLHYIACNPCGCGLFVFVAIVLPQMCHNIKKTPPIGVGSVL